MVTTLCRLASFFSMQMHKTAFNLRVSQKFSNSAELGQKKTANVNEFIDGKQENRKTRVGRLND